MSLLTREHQANSLCDDHQDDTPYHRPLIIPQTTCMYILSSCNIGNEKSTYKWEGAILFFLNIYHLELS